MLKNISKKIFSIFICLLIFNLSFNGNVSSNITSTKKQAVIGIGVGQFNGFLSFILGMETAEESAPEGNDNSSNPRSQLSEEDNLFIHYFNFSLASSETDSGIIKQEKNSNPQSHILEIIPPPPKV